MTYELKPKDKINVLFSEKETDNLYDVEFISRWNEYIIVEARDGVRLVGGVFVVERILDEKERFMLGLEELKGDIEDTQFAERMFGTGKYKYIGDKVAEV